MVNRASIRRRNNGCRISKIYCGLVRNSFWQGLVSISLLCSFISCRDENLFHHSVPIAPSDLEVKLVRSHAVLKWVNHDNCAQIRVTKYFDNFFGYQGVNRSVTTLEDYSITPGQSYDYAVRALCLNSGNEVLSAESNRVNLKIPLTLDSIEILSDRLSRKWQVYNLVVNEKSLDDYMNFRLAIESSPGQGYLTYTTSFLTATKPIASEPWPRTGKLTFDATGSSKLLRDDSLRIDYIITNSGWTSTGTGALLLQLSFTYNRVIWKYSLMECHPANNCY